MDLSVIFQSSELKYIFTPQTFKAKLLAIMPNFTNQCKLSMEIALGQMVLPFCLSLSLTVPCHTHPYPLTLPYIAIMPFNMICVICKYIRDLKLEILLSRLRTKYYVRNFPIGYKC